MDNQEQEDGQGPCPHLLILLLVLMVLVDILLGHLLVLVLLLQRLLILKHRLTNASALRLYLLILLRHIQSDPHHIDERVMLRLGEVTLVEELVVTPTELQVQESEAGLAQARNLSRRLHLHPQHSLCHLREHFLPEIRLLETVSLPRVGLAHQRIVPLTCPERIMIL